MCRKFYQNFDPKRLMCGNFYPNFDQEWSICADFEIKSTRKAVESGLKLMKLWIFVLRPWHQGRFERKAATEGEGRGYGA